MSKKPKDSADEREFVVRWKFDDGDTFDRTLGKEYFDKLALTAKMYCSDNFKLRELGRKNFTEFSELLARVDEAGFCSTLDGKLSSGRSPNPWAVAFAEQLKSESNGKCWREVWASIPGPQNGVVVDGGNEDKMQEYEALVYRDGEKLCFFDESNPHKEISQSLTEGSFRKYFQKAGKIPP